MSFITLQEVCLDYIVKTGSDSIKKSVIHWFESCFRQQQVNQVLKWGRNSSYRALNKITLDINKGDRIGLLGRNGAGKSSLLRVLAKVYKPHVGRIVINGKISCLFDVHLGMNTEATGYENIVNLSIMRGISKYDISKMVGDIEAFTELGSF